MFLKLLDALTHLSQDLKKFAMNYYLLRIFLAPPWEVKRFGTVFLAVRDDKKNDKCQVTLTSKEKLPRSGEVSQKDVDAAERRYVAQGCI